MLTSLFQKSTRSLALPTRLCHARNHPCGSKLAEGNPRHLKATQIGTAATGNHTTVDEPSRARITRKHGKTNIVFFLLQLVTEISVTGDSLRLAVVSSFPAFSCHGGGGNKLFDGVFKRFLRKIRFFAIFKRFSATEPLFPKRHPNASFGP